MLLSKFGITLESLSAYDLELVRYWRNQSHVRQNMKYKKIISTRMQMKWFNNLIKENNIYFVIRKELENIGVVNLKDINRVDGIAEAGIFIGEINYLNTLTPLLATIAIMDFAFESLGLKKLKAKISAENVKAIVFNESLGYEKMANQEEEEFQYYETTYLKYLDATKNIRNTLNKLNISPPKLILTKDEMSDYHITSKMNKKNLVKISVARS